MHNSCSHYNAICNQRFKNRIELRTQLQELHHHFPSSTPPFLTTPLHYHFPSSPLPFLNTSPSLSLPPSPLPSSPPIVPTSLRHHSPSSPLPFITTSLPQHFPSSHLPSSPLPFITTSHRNHIPSLPPCVIASYAFVMYSYVIYHPSSRSIHSFLFFCYVLPPIIKVNSIASYSFVMYC